MKSLLSLCLILKNHSQTHTRHFQTQMDLSGQGKGIYLIEFRFEKDVAVRKLVVE